MTRSPAILWDEAIAKCCEEPVHIPGTIQPFGALVVADLALETITHASANLPQILGLEPNPLPAPDGPAPSEDNPNQEDKLNWDWDGTDVLGRSLNSLLPDELIRELTNTCRLPWINTQREQMGAYEVNGRSLNVCVHVHGNRTLVELEPLIPTEKKEQALASRLKLHLEGNQNKQTVLAQCAEELRYATGFDRIMAYRFLNDGSGEVIAETRPDDMESFLNLRFPATDIPDSTRKILRKTALRLIPDLNASLVPLLAGDDTEAPLDLSLISIRGTSLVHTQEYLPNMGIAGSMTLAITLEGQLWGVFAFHHRQPKLLSPEFRANLELCGLLISLYIQKKQAEEDITNQRKAARLLSQLFGQQVKTNDSWTALVTSALPQLFQLILADGLAFVSDGKVLSTHGDLPDSSAVLKLIKATQAQGDGHGWAIDSLSRINGLEDLSKENWNTSAGALFLPIDFNGSHFLVFFRNETITKVKWAGNPDGQTLQGKNLTGVQLRPKRSFDTYKQLVKGTCQPWSRQELIQGQELSASLENQVFLQERQNLMIAELKHRVKNILALISSVVHQTSRSTKSVDHYVKMLDKRISALAMAHELVTGRELTWPKFQDLLALELRPYLNENTTFPRVTVTGPEVTLNSSFVPTMSLVLHEMVSNAVKYGALSVPDGRLVICWFESRNGLTLLWKEINGPVVQQPENNRRGFGTKLIERAIPYEFSGEANLIFSPSGMEVIFWLPQTLVQWATTQSSSVPKSPVQESPVSKSPPNVSRKLEKEYSVRPQVTKDVDKGSVLLVEDNMLITIEMENLLTQYGFSTVDSAPTVARAMQLLNNDPDRYQFGLLDINLKTETSFEIAYHLAQNNIPFAFLSGYDSKHAIPGDLKNIPLFKKPVTFEILSTRLQTLETKNNCGKARKLVDQS